MNTKETLSRQCLQGHEFNKVTAKVVKDVINRDGITTTTLEELFTSLLQVFANRRHSILKNIFDGMQCLAGIGQISERNVYISFGGCNSFVAEELLHYA